MLQDFESEDHESDTRADGGDDLDEGQSEHVLLKPVVGSPRRNPHKVFPAASRHNLLAERSISPTNYALGSVEYKRKVSGQAGFR
jgi:hypothetical protein